MSFVHSSLQPVSAALQADLVLQPFMERFALAMPAFASFDVHSTGRGRVGAWLQTMAEAPSCKIASPDPELFLAAVR